MDIDHYFSGDIGISIEGDISLANELTTSQQRIIRRVLTNPGDYPSDPTYGAGAGKYVGVATMLLGSLKSLIAGQVLREPSVSPVPTPTVLLKSDSTVLHITIKYVDTLSQSTQTLIFDTGV